MATPNAPAPLSDRLLTYGRMIRFSHSIFALPFALTSAALAAREGFRWSQIGWIVLAMVGARSAAMGFNRLADQEIDARNPRTAARELDVTTLALDPTFLGRGVALGVDQRGSRLQILVDRAEAKAEGADLSGELLEMAQEIQR